ncbi:hypothetical protein ACTACG_21560 [Pseudomonas syringae]|uniref:hypothetical protein n=1 Tax=Pseudomonas syringae TaxID=317 RepID=UPI003F754430
MATYKFEFRHRANASEAIGKRHEAFISAITGLAPPWNLAKLGALPGIGAELLITVSLDKFLPKGVKGRLTYMLRNEKYLKDDAQYDDTCFIEFDSGKIDLQDFTNEIFTTYIKAFKCYRATLHDWSITRNDWPVVVETGEKLGKDINCRDGIYRINLINYFDETLCQKAFGMSACEIAKRLKNHAKTATEFESGLLLILEPHILSSNEWKERGDSVKRVLQHARSE